jgi:signal transduction histidine kinase/FixJ family two-component response regulator
MAILRSLIHALVDAVRTIRPLHAQFLFTALAFAAMICSSALYVNNMLHSHLRRDATDMLMQTRLNIEAELIEPETAMASIVTTVRRMILRGDDAQRVHGYLRDISRELQAKTGGFNFTELFGYFPAFGDKMLASFDWRPPTDFDPTSRPWYMTAMEADDKITTTPIYTSLGVKKNIITYVRRVADDGGRTLGILCLNLPLDNIIRYVTEMRLTRNSYGVFHDKNRNIFYHPYTPAIGKNADDMGGSISELASEATRDDLYERERENYRGDPIIAFSMRLDNGWTLYTMTPKAEYFQELTEMEIILGLFGAALAAGLCGMLLRVDRTREKLNAENRRKNVMLATVEATSRSKSIFLANMSHEIRTPMNAILGITEIQMQKESLPPDMREVFGRIYNSSELLLGIINDILDMSKIEAGKLELAPLFYDVSSLINDTVQLNMVRIGSKPLDFELRVDENVPLMVWGDALRIKQILNNLLSNAFKYTESGKVRMSIFAEQADGRPAQSPGVFPDPGSEPGSEPALKKPDVTLVFVVHDTGPGMTTEQVSMLFDEYSRFNLTAKRRIEGTGLGMSITRRLVRMMHGDISVHSAPGRGSTFTVKLPQTSAGPEVIGRELAENLQRFRLGNASAVKRTLIVREPMPYGNVLGVDDVETNLYVARGLLAPYELEIECVDSGFAAIEKIKKGKTYDIIFMDHMMPGMDGMETTEIIRGLGYARPIIALTADAVVGQAEMFRENGFDDFIAKPIDMRQMNAALNKFVRDRHPPAVVAAARQRKKRAEEERTPPSPQPEMAKLFVRDAAKSLAVLEALRARRGSPGSPGAPDAPGSPGALSEEDMRAYVINIHGMKSALANIGEAELSAAARRLEQAGREKGAGAMPAETDAFLNALRQVITRLAPLSEKDAGAEAGQERVDATLTDADEAWLRDHLRAIRAACAAFDKKAAKDALTELQQKTWPRPTRELLDTFAECLLHGKFKKIVSMVDATAA